MTNSKVNAIISSKKNPLLYTRSQFRVSAVSRVRTHQNINLNNPNQIYIKIYKAARKKAKDIRKQALHAYLDAEKIKNMYLLENIDDSDESYESE